MHQLTALSGKMSARDMRHPERSPVATMTNRLRTEGTDHLLAAGRAVGAPRLTAPSFGAFRWDRTRGPGTEAIRSTPTARGAPVPLVGILHVEQTVPAIEWGEGLVRATAVSTVPGRRSAWLRTR